MFNMAGNYEERNVDTYDENGLFIDTARVTDGRQPYETAVAHPNYNGGKMVIVEAYNTKKQARVGHNKWVKTMTAFPLPLELRDCHNSRISQFGATLLGEDSAGGGVVLQQEVGQSAHIFRPKPTK